MGKQRRRAGSRVAAWVALATAALLLCAWPASAGGRQMGFVVGKDVATGRVTLHTGVVLEVTSATRIVSKAGARMTLGNLAVADASDGALVADPQALVRYEGRMHNGRVSASLIRVAIVRFRVCSSRLSTTTQGASGDTVRRITRSTSASPASYLSRISQSRSSTSQCFFGDRAALARRFFRSFLGRCSQNLRTRVPS